MNHHSRGLIHHDHILVFVEHVQWDLFRSRSHRRTRENFDVDDIAGHHPLRSPGQPFADVNTALIDQLLNASAAEIGKA